MGMHPLGQLINSRMQRPEHRWSFRDVARRAQAAGETLSKSTVQSLAQKMTPQISRNTIYGLAAGLGVTPLTVGNAALESWDIETRPAEVTDSLATVGIDPTLSEQDKRRLRALIIDMRSDVGRAVEPRTAPITEGRPQWRPGDEPEDPPIWVPSQG